MAGVTETVQIAARIPTNLRDELEKIAEREDRPLSYVLRQALKAHVEASKTKGAA